MTAFVISAPPRLIILSKEVFLEIYEGSGGLGGFSMVGFWRGR
jgi:hypothetical protein